MKNYSLLKRFTILSFIPFIITGIILSFFESEHIRKDQIQDIMAITHLTLNALLMPDLSSEEFTRPFSADKIKTLNQKLDQIMKSSDVIAIKIWDTRGNILYSDNSALISKNFKSNEELSTALSGKVSYNIAKPDKDENRNLLAKNNKIIEIYEPIIFNDKLVGAFEIYRPYDETEKHLMMLNRNIILTMFLGLLILYLFLLKIIFNASNTLIIQNKSLQEQKTALEESFVKLNNTYKNTVITLSKAVDARDPHTAGHSERVTKIALKIGSNLGLPIERLEILELGAMFHDIGKLGVPDNILLKPGRLSEDEFKKIKEHPSIGVNILKGIGFLKDVLPIILHHHEKVAGDGYPAGIKGNEIPFESRIIAVVDTYDAITSDRPYRKGLSHNYALDEIKKNKGIQFDLDVVDAFLSIASFIDSEHLIV